MSTTLLIGRCPAAASRACSHSGEGPIVDVGEDAGGEARAELGHLDRDRGVVGGLPLPLGRRVLGPGIGGERRAGDRVDLAGDAVDAEAVAAVRGHLDLQHRLAQRQHLGQRRARRRARRRGP